MAEVQSALSRAEGETLTREGIHAYTVSRELQALARDNTPVGLKVAAKAERRHHIDVAALVVLLGLALVWIGGNLVGYATSDKASLVVSGSGIHRTVQLADGSTAGADCWASGGVATVWEAAPPANWVVPYRCGDGALSAGIPGVLSAMAALVALLAAFGLRLAWRRRQRLAWY